MADQSPVARRLAFPRQPWHRMLRADVSRARRAATRSQRHPVVARHRPGPRDRDPWSRSDAPTRTGAADPSRPDRAERAGRRRVGRVFLV